MLTNLAFVNKNSKPLHLEWFWVQLDSCMHGNDKRGWIASFYSQRRSGRKNTEVEP